MKATYIVKEIRSKSKVQDRENIIVSNYTNSTQSKDGIDHPKFDIFVHFFFI